MKLIKLILVLILVGAVAAGGFQVLANRGMIPADKVALVQTWTQKIAAPLGGLNLNLSEQTFSVDQATTALQNLPELASVASNSGAVLGTSVQVETEVPPLPQRAFEYGRYIYCQEVVKDYETRYPQP